MKIQISPLELKDFLEANNWTIIPEAKKDGIFLFNSPNHKLDFNQLDFPIEPAHPYFEQKISATVTEIAKIFQLDQMRMEDRIRESSQDLISFRYANDDKPIAQMSLTDMASAIDGAKQLLQWTAQSVIKPKSYFKGSPYSEVKDFIRKTTFCHTEHGSFIFKIGTPLTFDIPDNQLSLLDGVADTLPPFERQVIAKVNALVITLKQKIQLGEIDQFAQSILASDSPEISYNTCESLEKLFDTSRELPLELSFKYSTVAKHKHHLKPVSLPNIVTFDYQDLTNITQLKSYIRPNKEAFKDTLFGTVEELKGNFNSDGIREGEVLLKLIIDTDYINVKCVLSPENYIKAYQAHATPSAIIKITGVFKPTPNGNHITDIELFEIVNQ